MTITYADHGVAIVVDPEDPDRVELVMQFSERLLTVEQFTAIADLFSFAMEHVPVRRKS